MPTDEQYEELQRLIASQAERIYKLEQIAGLQPRPAQPPERRAEHVPLFPNQPAQPKQPPASDAEAELESKIGGHWLNRVGIMAVLIGVSYFLKYAFENQWIGPAGRVLIGLTGGLAIVFWSEQVRRSGYRVFSYSLKAVGIGVLYLSLWASSQLYHLIPNALAFFSMMTVTAATAGMALWQDAEVIAAFAAVGGFITPVVLSTGVNDAAGLFTYVFILDLGALFLVRYRRWTRILIGSYIGTLILYSSWHSTFYTPDQFWTALISISTVFAVFLLTPFVMNRERAEAEGAIAFLSLLNAATYFFEVWELFEHASETRQAAIAAVGLACLYFAIGYQLKRRALAVIAEVHWAIAAALMIAAVPIGLHSPWITIAWFVEGAALLRVSYRANAGYLKKLAAVALALGAVRIVAVDDFPVVQLIFNQRMLAFAIAVAALADVAHTLDRMKKEEDRIPLAVVIVGMNLLSLVALTREITDAWRRQLQSASPGQYMNIGIVRDFAYSALWMTYGAGLMVVGFLKESRFVRWQALILIGVTICKVFLYDISSLDRGYRIVSLIALGLVLLGTSFWYQRSRTP